MANLSNYLETALFNHLFRNVAYTSPTTVYVALYTSDPTDDDTGVEVTGGSYAREAVAFDAPTNGVGDNSSLITFTAPTAAWGNVTHWAIRDALTSGNLLFHATLTGSRNIKNGDTVTIAANTLICSFSGIGSNYLINALFNHVLRNSALTSPTAVYHALYISDPTANDTGGEVSGGSYAREAITFNAPSNGVGDNALISFTTPTANWGVVSHWAIRDALTAGNLLTFGPLVETRNVLNSDTVEVSANDLSQSVA